MRAIQHQNYRCSHKRNLYPKNKTHTHKTPIFQAGINFSKVEKKPRNYRRKRVDAF